MNLNPHFAHTPDITLDKSTLPAMRSGGQAEMEPEKEGYGAPGKKKEDTRGRRMPVPEQLLVPPNAEQALRAFDAMLLAVEEKRAAQKLIAQQSETTTQLGQQLAALNTELPSNQWTLPPPPEIGVLPPPLPSPTTESRVSGPVQNPELELSRPLEPYLAEQLRSEWGAEQTEIEEHETLHLVVSVQNRSVFRGRLGNHTVTKDAQFSEGKLQEIILTLEGLSVTAAERILAVYTAGRTGIGDRPTYVGENVFAQVYTEGANTVIEIQPNKLKGSMKMSVGP